MTVKRVRGAGAQKQEDEVPSPRAPLARVVSSVFSVEVTVEAYLRLERELALADPTRPEVVRLALNRAQANASEAHRLYVVAKVEFELFETECLRYMAKFREEAIRALKAAEAQPGRAKKDITEKDVSAMLAKLFPDQVLVEQERREKSRQTVAHLYRLAELWKERTYALGQLK
jgi:hypothetical protein